MEVNKNIMKLKHQETTLNHLFKTTLNRSTGGLRYQHNVAFPLTKNNDNDNGRTCKMTLISLK